MPPLDTTGAVPVTEVTVPKLPVKATPLALKTPVEGTKLSFVELVVIGKLPVVVDTSVGYHVALELVLSVTATFVAFVAVVDVVALAAEPEILTAKEVIEPLAAFKRTAVVPIYKVELPKTALGIVPDKFPAVKLVRLAPQQITVNAAGNKGLIIKGAASQTADLQEWQNSAGTVLGGANALAQIYTGSIAPALVATGGATTAATGDGTTATITTTSAHGLAVGDLVTVAGVTPTGYNGTFLVTAVASTTISYANATTGAQTVAGTVSAPAQASVTARSAGSVGLIVKGAASQTADLQEWQNSSGTTISWVNSTGGISLPRTALIRFNGGVGTDRAYITSNTNNDLIFATASGVEGFRLYGGSIPSGALITNSNAGAQGLIIKAAASQTADLQQWQNSAGTVLAKVDANGNITAANYTIDPITAVLLFGGM